MDCLVPSMLYTIGAFFRMRPLAVCLLPFLFWSCSNEPSVVTYREAKAPEATSNNENSGSESKATQEIGYEAPDGWEPGRASSMRMASFSVPTSSEAADVSLIKLAGMAGGLLANVNRWRGQVGLSPISDEELTSILEESETEQGKPYFRLSLINETSGQSILAGIYLREDYTLFAKLTAAMGAATEASESFFAFCDSVTFPQEP